jgi:hypothetical protein
LPEVNGQEVLPSSALDASTSRTMPRAKSILNVKCKRDGNKPCPAETLRCLFIQLELETGPSPIGFSGRRILMALMLAEETDRLTRPTLPMLYEIIQRLLG